MGGPPDFWIPAPYQVRGRLFARMTAKRLAAWGRRRWGLAAPPGLPGLDTLSGFGGFVTLWWCGRGYARDVAFAWLNDLMRCANDRDRWRSLRRLRGGRASAQPGSRTPVRPTLHAARATGRGRVTGPGRAAGRVRAGRFAKRPYAGLAWVAMLAVGVVVMLVAAACGEDAPPVTPTPTVETAAVSPTAQPGTPAPVTAAPTATATATTAPTATATPSPSPTATPAPTPTPVKPNRHPDSNSHA